MRGKGGEVSPAGLRAALSGAVFALLCACGALAQAANGAADHADPIAAGRRLFLEGLRGDGSPLLATRAGGGALRGGEAACVNCHRRSGLGGAEGRSYIPPIDAHSLFVATAPGSGASAAGIGRPAYSDRTLARALRRGVDAAGRRLDFLMPRYALSTADAKALFAYLDQLSTQLAPGVAADTLDFATVIAAGVDSVYSAAMLDVLRACFDERNAGPPPGRGRKRLGPEMNIGAQRPWRLHVWTLDGQAETWTEQLAEHARRVPVFALVGGLGGGTWAPVHAFCETNSLPCLFPRVEVPGADKPGFYSLYFHRGVHLEAALIARSLTDSGRTVHRVLQVRRAGDEAARSAAETLRRLLSERGIEVEDRLLAGPDTDDAKLLETTAGQALVLWLRPEDLQRLGAFEPPVSEVYLSATLADPERLRLADSWKARALLAYPYELPEKRERHTTLLNQWLQGHGLSQVDVRVQADAFLACTLLANGINEIAGKFQRDYLVERLEVLIERRDFNGPYPRLALGAGQRFASKTGYLVRFAAAESPRLVPVGDRVAP